MLQARRHECQALEHETFVQGIEEGKRRFAYGDSGASQMGLLLPFLSIANRVNRRLSGVNDGVLHGEGVIQDTQKAFGSNKGLPQVDRLIKI